VLHAGVTPARPEEYELEVRKEFRLADAACTHVSYRLWRRTHTSPWWSARDAHTAPECFRKGHGRGTHMLR
jgi:hypothetical protein